MMAWTMRPMGIFTLISSLFFAATPALALPDESSIPAFLPVTEQIYRGGEPELPAGLEMLAQKGFKTILNIGNDEDFAASELEVAGPLGLTQIVSPMSWFWAPSDEQINEILAKMQDPTLQPLFVHCHHGEDRTGLVIGIYRVEVQGWTPEAAYQEMLDKGFHSLLFPLDQYFRDRTGYRP